MPLQTQNFMQMGIHKPDLSNLTNLSGLIAKGYENAQLPEKLERERIRDEMLNQIYGHQAKRGEIENQYLPQEKMLGVEGLQLGNKGKQQELEWNPRRWGAEIFERHAHAKEYGAQSEKHRLEAQKLAAVLSMLQGGGEMAPPEQGMSGEAPTFAQQGLPEYGQEIPQAPQQQRANTQTYGMGNGNAFREAVIGHEFGIKPYSEQNENGELVTQYLPGGPIHTVKVGPTKAEIAEMMESGKLTAQDKEAVINEIDASYAKEPIFQELLSAINSPEYFQGVGPAMSRLAKLTDNPEANAIIGNIDTLLGNLVNESFKQFGNRGNQSEYKAMQKIKGSTSDNPYALRSKVKLMYALDKYNREVKLNYYKNLRTMPRLEAKQKAVEDTNYSEVKNIVKIDDMAHKAAQSQKSDYGTIMKAAERFVNEHGGSIEDALKILGKKHGK